MIERFEDFSHEHFVTRVLISYVLHWSARNSAPCFKGVDIVDKTTGSQYPCPNMPDTLICVHSNKEDTFLNHTSSFKQISMSCTRCSTREFGFFWIRCSTRKSLKIIEKNIEKIRKALFLEKSIFFLVQEPRLAQSSGRRCAWGAWRDGALGGLRDWTHNYSIYSRIIYHLM